jgi:hypothetical protein
MVALTHAISQATDWFWPNGRKLVTQRATYSPTSAPKSPRAYKCDMACVRATIQQVLTWWNGITNTRYHQLRKGFYRKIRGGLPVKVGLTLDNWPLLSVSPVRDPEDKNQFNGSCVADGTLSSVKPTFTGRPPRILR